MWVETRTSTTANYLYKGSRAHGKEQHDVCCISIVVNSTHVARHVRVSQSRWQRHGRYTASVTVADRYCCCHSGQYTYNNLARTIQTYSAASVSPVVRIMCNNSLTFPAFHAMDNQRHLQSLFPPSPQLPRPEDVSIFPPP